MSGEPQGAVGCASAVTADTVRRARILAHRYYAPGMDHDDLMQEALVAAWKARDSWRPERGPFGAFEWLCMNRWLSTVVRLALSEKRGAGDHCLELDERTTSSHVSVADTVEQRTELRRVLDVLPSLSLLERRAVVGIAIGASYRELGADEKSVDNAAYRARLKLRAA